MGGWLTATATPAAAQPQAKQTQPKQTQAKQTERAHALAEQISLTGSTGLLRTSRAGSGAPGSFRMAVLANFYGTSGFLCNADTPCDAAGSEDETGGFGALFAVNATPFRFLEAYAGVRGRSVGVTVAASELSFIGVDANLGAKLFTPFKIKNVMSLGGELRLTSSTGEGDVGTSGSPISADFGLLTSFDFREIIQNLPLRLHVNGGYHLDNSAGQLADTEESRAASDPAAAGDLNRIPVSRAERFVVGVDRVDSVNLRVGVDVPFASIQPYLEYSLDVPLNRQGYACETRTVAQGDVCLALQNLDDPFSGSHGYGMMPSRLSLGTRVTPFDGGMRGLSAHLAFDLGLSATSIFVEEVAPEAPWAFHLGLAYVFDSHDDVKPAPVAPPVAHTPRFAPAARPQYYLRGVVTVKGSKQPIGGAIIGVHGLAVPPVASAPNGRFQTYPLAPGVYRLNVFAPGYVPATCMASVQPPASGVGQTPAGAPSPMRSAAAIFINVSCELQPNVPVAPTPAAPAAPTPQAPAVEAPGDDAPAAPAPKDEAAKDAPATPATPGDDAKDTPPPTTTP
jgi:hypothetical protein